MLGPARAAQPRPSLASLDHTSWTERHGAPLNIVTMAETRDGFLWLGSGRALYRFDGVSFTEATVDGASFPGTEVYKLVADPGGGLWIGWAIGGISFLKDGKLHNYGTKEGAPSGTIWDFAFDQERGVWAAGLGGVSRFDGHAWRKIGAAEGFTGQRGSTVFVANDGTVAIFSEKGLYTRAKGAQRFSGPLGTTDTGLPPQQRQDGTLYYYNDFGIRRIAGLPRYEKTDFPWLHKKDPSQPGMMLLDRSGMLWFNTAQGLHRLNPQDAGAGMETYTSRDGLTGNGIQAFAEDHEGNIWVATAQGLDRFRKNNVTPLVSPFQLGGARLLSDTDGTVLLGSEAVEASWVRASPNGDVSSVGPNLSTTAVMRDHQQRVWRGGATAIARFDQRSGRRTDIGYPPGLMTNGELHQLGEDASGTVWASFVGAGVFRYQNNAWRQEVLLPNAGKNPAVNMVAASDGGMWFGYTDNRLSYLKGNTVTSFTAAQGMTIRKVALLKELGGHLWIGGEGGLMRRSAGAFHRVEAALPHAFDGAVDIVDTAGGYWIHSLAGLVYLSHGEAAKSIREPRHQVRLRVFNEQDGLHGFPALLDPDSLALATDGKIWISNMLNSYVIDPATIRADPTPARVHLDQVDADGVARRPGALMQLPANVGRVRIDFTSPAVTSGEQLRFRYKLEGYDAGWTPLAKQRKAEYTSLPPGRYRLMAQAVNRDDVAGPATLLTELEVPPTIVQTAWFKAACALLALALLWYAYHLRLRTRFRELMARENVRQAERDRIARELHDTLLQGVQGMLLQFQSIANAVPADAALRKNMEQALDSAEKVITEGRERVQELRVYQQVSSGFADSIGYAGASLAEHHQVPFTLEVKGAARALKPGIDYQWYRIINEAVLNAYKHARASAIEVLITYDAAGLHGCVRDDGTGFECSDAAAHDAPGHWGLVGVRERVALLCGGMRIASAPGAGTTVTFSLPAALAFDDE
ncbi:sensor histidine kinase [Duganella sp. CF517]|uniref:sensor histidine kinase n=1 Tax=Duganella sp. CF517 TaxID=1881038 RepID=UPI0015A4F4B9|nr:sensor histidine kinase [Duganella sp. CF517]